MVQQLKRFMAAGTMTN